LPSKKFFEPVLTSIDEDKRAFTITDVMNSDTYTHVAFVHGEDSEGDYEIGDRQDLFRDAWGLMTEEQKIDLLFTNEATAVPSAAEILTD
jgi:hypothetical protein